MKILIANDAFIAGSGLRAIIFRRYLGVDILEVKTAAALEDALRTANYDLVLTACTLNGTDIIARLPTLVTLRPGLRIVCVAGQGKQVDGGNAIGAGAAGIIPDNATEAALYDCIDTCLAGGIYKHQAFKQSRPSAIQRLSRREYEIMLHLVDGLKNGEIAKANNIGTSTVSTYKNRIFGKLKVSSVARLSVLCRELNV